MKLAISMPAMQYAVKLASGFAASATDIAELRCLKIDSTGDMLTITAFNRTAWVKIRVAGAEVAVPGVCLIPAVEMRKWLSAGDNSRPLEVECVGDSATLTNGKAKFRISTLDVNKYADPTIATVQPTTAVMPAKEIVRGLSSVSFAIDKKDLDRNARTDTVLLDIEDGVVNLMATDAKVVSLVELKATVNGPKIDELLPYSSVAMLIPLLESAADGDATIKLSNHEAVIETERFEFGARLAVGKKLPWRSIIKAWDRNRPEKIAIAPKEFLAAIRQVVAAAANDEMRLELEFAAHGAKLSLENNKAYTFYDIPGNTIEMSFAFQWDYLTDLFNSVVRQDLPVTLEWGVNDGRNLSVLFRIGAGWRYMGVPLVGRNVQ